MSEIELIPPANSLIESLRAFGYSFETAIADLIDNSITAGATEINVHIDDDDELRVAVIDNGTGMTPEELLLAMTPGGRSPRDLREPTDLGRFSLGLKTASFSQCRRVTVMSRKNKTVSAVTWDLDLVAEREKWVAVVHPDAGVLSYFNELGPQGTAVVWEKIDRISGCELAGESRARAHALNAQTNALSDHLQMVFHRFMEGERGFKRVDVTVNGSLLTPFDPFNRNHPATTFLPREVIQFAGAEVVVQPVVLPHFSKVDKATWNRHAGPRGYLRGQGFYVYRNRRLIVDGSWLRLMRQSPITQLARVQVDIDNALDHEWRIGVKKDSAELPLPVRERLKEIIDLIDLQARRPFTRRGAMKASADRFPMWLRLQDAGVISYRANLEHPSIGEFSSLLPSELRAELERLLTLISSSLPLDTIFSDLGADGASVTPGEVGREVLESGIRLMFDRLAEAGLNSDDITVALLAVEPYRSNRETVEDLITALRKDGK